MKEEYIESIYAGWLAKIIGIRLGAPVEGWTYEKIKNIFGELTDYPVDYHEFAADDDSNGPLFFLRALEDKRHGFDLKAQDVAEALLNYAPFEHGFFWWGGYGVSTEHTAYLNLRNGIPAPRSGSKEQNGSAVAEQIGGQIFIDTWGLVTPGNPDLAAKYAREAASVTHDGSGVCGGIFVAVCVSYSFVEKDIKKIIHKGLSYIPEECEYAKVVLDVIRFYDSSPGSWRECFKYIYENYGYDKYPGNCHIIPNTAVMILALLYGEGDFSDTLNICDMCGWDTDCNVGNVATIMGVRNGLSGIDYHKWRKPINDFLVCSSVIGSLNIMDIPYGASYIVKMAYKVAGKNIPKPWKTIIEQRIHSCHFEYPGSTHAIRVRTEGLDIRAKKEREYTVINTDESAYTGSRCLKFMAKPVEPGENVYVYQKTYYKPEDFHDSRYDPCFSPLVYPGQTVHGSVMIPVYGVHAQVSLYVHDSHTGQVFHSEKIRPELGTWSELEFRLPPMEGVLFDEMGFCFHVEGVHTQVFALTGLIDDLYADGGPDYTLRMDKEEEEVWTGTHREISQFTKLKGLMYLADGQLNLSCSDFAEAYTGRYDWEDYEARFFLTPVTGEHHMVNIRVQGAVRSYAAGLLPGGKFGILKNDNGYSLVVQEDFFWQPGKEYVICISAKDNRVKASVDGRPALEFTDRDHVYERGSIGVALADGSHCRYRKIEVRTQ